MSEQIQTRFPNKAGNNPDNDSVLRSELELAGIPVQSFRILKDEGEVKSSIIGVLHNTSFKRAWYYWIARIEGGLPLDVAVKLHEQHGTALRVGGFAGGCDPREMCGGFGVMCYHIDTQESLKVLADALKDVVAKNAKVCKDLGLKPWPTFE